jgi:hypothetical protein
MLGATFIGKELAEGRFGFYLSRPLGGTSIWLGKLLGAVLTVVCCELVLLAPLVALHWPPEPLNFGTLSGAATSVNLAALVLILAPFGLMAVAHVAGIMWRARSAWIALDMAALAAAGLAAWQAYRTVEPHLDWYYPTYSSFSDRLVVYIPGTISLAVVLLTSAWVASIAGRVDLRRTHAALSVTLSVLLLTASVSVLGLARWMVDTGLDELTWVNGVSASPSSQWLAFRGGTTRVLPLRNSFLYHHPSRTLVRITPSPASPWRGTSVSFSNSGSWAAWLVPFDGNQYQTVVADLRTDDPVISRTRLLLEAQPPFAISDDGRWLAVRQRLDLSRGETLAGHRWGTNTVYELPSGRLAASWTTPDEHESMRPVFMLDGTVRTYVEPVQMGQKETPTDLQVFEIDTADGHVREVATVPNQESVYSILIDDPHDRVLLRGRGSGASTWTLAVLDGGTHRRLFAVEGGPDPFAQSALSDGRIAAWRNTGGQIELVLLDDRGETDKVIAIGRGARAWIGLEPAPGRLEVVIFSNVELRGSLKTVEIDLANGRFRVIGRDLIPMLPAEQRGDAYLNPEPGSIITRCLRGRNGALKIWNPATGRLDVIVAGFTGTGMVYRDWPDCRY